MKEGKRVELLAPAGELDGVIGAINAGADAVYLGAPSFSARAYAKNLTSDEIIDMIQYAHLFGRKIYLALNILMKNKELQPAIEMLCPLYEAGLDAVIVQDLGLLSMLSKCFPKLELHASTQMAIMSRGGVELLKDYHVKRVVPARELSIEEIIAIKESGLELECFIHGAMCYSYSGRCLLSSMAGGRSGNRGRCAGTCRQQYHTKYCKECYLLSMKDMCSIQHLKELLDCGIDSFKIEGRMKAPEYSAGVTAIYRKYIDQYYREGACKVSSKDLNNLNELYIRSEIQEGYYHKYNGKDMISLSSPSYRKISEEQKNSIHEKYIKERKKVPIDLLIQVKQGENVKLTLFYKDITLTLRGDIAEAAAKRPVSNEEIEKQLRKTGNTNYIINKCEITNDLASFVPISALNDYRRRIIEQLKLQIQSSERKALPYENSLADLKQAEHYALRIGVLTQIQLNTVLENDFYDGVILPLDLFKEENIAEIRTKNKKVFMRLPDLIREKHRIKVEEKAKNLFQKYRPDAIYCNCIDALSIALGMTDSKHIIADAGLYALNSLSESEIIRYACEYTASYELNNKELSHAVRKDLRQIVIYGRIPVMYSANCILKTSKKCDTEIEKMPVYDEKNHQFHAVLNHEYCYNTIYNCVPLSLHNVVRTLIEHREAAIYRIEFTVETKQECNQILTFYQTPMEHRKELELDQYTNGHFNRGVE